MAGDKKAGSLKQICAITMTLLDRGMDDSCFVLCTYNSNGLPQDGEGEGGAASNPIVTAVA